MPEGIEVLVEDGLATIDFVDLSLKNEGIATLLEHTPPEQVEPLTREKGAERVRYRVPLECAKAAGMVDEASKVNALASLPVDSFTDASGFVETPGPSMANLHAQEVRTGVYADAYGGTTVVTEGDGSTVEVGQFVQPVGVEVPADGAFTELVGEATGSPHSDLPVIDNPEGTVDLTPPAFDDGGQLSSAVEMTNTSGEADTDSPPPSDHTGVTENDPSGVSPLPTGDFAPAVEPTTEAPAGVEASQPAPAADDPAPSKTYDDGFPDMDWKRDAIDAYAGKLTPPLDTTSEPNKPSAIQAIKDAIAAGATAP